MFPADSLTRQLLTIARGKAPARDENVGSAKVSVYEVDYSNAKLRVNVLSQNYSLLVYVPPKCGQ